MAEAGRRRSVPRRWPPGILAIVLLGLVDVVQARDLHVEWEDRCAECHGHAGAFARERLAVHDGVLTSDHWGSDVARFLAHHHTTPATLAPLVAMLTEQATTPPLFAEHCAGCHGTAAELVRSDVVRRNGRLVGAASGRPLELFLRRHGGLEPDEQALVLQRLDRLHAETGGD